MISKHSFKLLLQWVFQKNDTKAIEKRTLRNHVIRIEGKENLHVSAAKVFKGDPNLHNPEDLLLASLSSCHMMSYLYCCSLHQIEVVSYEDQAEAILEVNGDGSGKIVKVTLRPNIIITNVDKLELAQQLHLKANELCFIANSCNFLIEHQVDVNVKKC